MKDLERTEVYCAQARFRTDCGPLAAAMTKEEVSSRESLARFCRFVDMKLVGHAGHAQKVGKGELGTLGWLRTGALVELLVSKEGQWTSDSAVYLPTRAVAEKKDAQKKKGK